MSERDWQPVETAPRGVYVLACWAPKPWTAQVLMQTSDGGNWVDEDDGNYAAPAYWMPLPEPPQ